MTSRNRPLRSSVLTCAILFPLLMFAARLLAQQQYPGLGEPEETTELVRGQVVLFSIEDHKIVIQAENGKEMTFGIDEHTNIISPIDPGSSVEVTYAVVNGANMARTLVNPALLLQIEHPTDRIHLTPLVVAGGIVVLIAVVLQRWRAKRRRT